MLNRETSIRIFLSVIAIIFFSWQSKAEAFALMCEDTMDIDIIGADVEKGDSVCVLLVFNGFTDLNSLQFSINWDPSVLEFSSLHDVNPGNVIDNLSPGLSFGLFDADQGSIRFIWYDQNVDGESAPDGFVVARLCFKAIGAPGDETDITIGNIPLRFEAIDTSQNTLCLREDGNETIRIILPTDLCVIARSCASRTGNGSITIEPFGGTPPYTVDIPSLAIAGDIINNQGDTRTYDMLNPGSYTIIVTDSDGNDTTIVMDILNVEPLKIDTVFLRLPTCSGNTNGIIEVAAYGGVPPYTYFWDPIPASGQTRLTRLPGDVYTLTVRDSLGCVSIATFDLNQDILSVDTSIIQFPSCDGKEDGIIKVVGSGGTPFPGGLYDFTWSVNPAANNRGMMSQNDMVGSSGYVIIEDDADCIDTIYFDLPAESNLEVTIATDSVECHGDTTGRVVVTANPAGPDSGPYSFLLFRESGPVVTGGGVLLNQFIHDNLWAGQFHIRVEDTAGCIVRDTFLIEQPDPFHVIITDADTSAGCSPGNDAFLEVSGFGGNGGPFGFMWDHQGRTTARIDSLEAGLYTVTVTDRKNCEAVRSFTIEGSQGPVIDSFNITNVGCVGDTSGSITVFYTQGDSAIASINWSNGDSGPTISNLGDGEYIVTITDRNGCMATDTAIVEVPPTSLQITSFIIDTPSCNGAMDGFLQIMVAGGSGNYRYQWSNNTMDSVLTNIGAGRYIVAVRDDSDCPPVIDTFDIPEPPAVEINILRIDPVTCNDDTTCNGLVIAEATGGPDPSLGYNFIWSSGEVGRSSPDTATMLCKGDQFVIAANGDCVDSVMINIPAPDALDVDFNASEFNRPSCAGDSDGSISIVTSGGTGTRRVRWDFGPTANQLDNLSAGTYAFYVEDDNGCRYRDSVELRNPDSLNAFILDAASRDISCNGDTDGRLVVAWNGGNDGPAQFDWSPSVSSDSIASDLSSGTYFITVTDSKGCIDSIQATIVDPPAIQADFPMSDTVDCFGGQIPVTIVGAVGGNGPDFTFAINNGPRRPLGEEVNLFSGNYLITVFDKDGCSLDSNIVIHQPTEIMVDLGPDMIEVNLGDSITICFQTNIPTGNIQNVSWSPDGLTTDTASRCVEVKPNNDMIVTVVVEDENGCTATDQVLIEVNKERRVFIPNVFNPTGNVNTKWEIHTGQGVDRILKAQIYDRWGELVYNQEDVQSGDGWDGTFMGTNRIMPNGVYVYLVEVLYLDGKKEIRRGGLTLIQ